MICKRLAHIRTLTAFTILSCGVFTTPATAASNKPAAAKPGPPFPGLSLSVKDATVPPGGMYQLQLFLTEPKPIVRGGSRLPSATGAKVQGVNIFDPAGKAMGVAVIDSTGINISVANTGGLLGSSIDWPIISVAMLTNPATPVGHKQTMNVDPAAIDWLDASGVQYPVETNSGVLTYGGRLNISNIIPGDGVVPVGSTISVIGAGFTSRSAVHIDGAITVTSKLVSSTRIDVTLDTAVNMDGRRVRVQEQGTRVEYYAYRRTTRFGASTRALNNSIDPIFSQQQYTTAFVPYTDSASSYTALALQNKRGTAVTVKIDLLDSAKFQIGSTTISLPAGSKLVRELPELTGAQTSSGTVRVTSSAPIQVMGAKVVPASRTAVPVAAKTTLP